MIATGLEVVMAMGNPWVFLDPSLPISIYTHTHWAWVRIFTGLALGMDMGTVSTDMGMDLKKKFFMGYTRYYTIIFQSSSD